MNAPLPYMGEVCALLTAVIWAAAVIFFKKSGEKVHPVALNLFKNILSIVLIFPTMLIAGAELLRPAPASEYLLMLLSGALGIGIADTMFFISLNLLGAGLTAIVDCMYSPLMIIMSMLWLAERLSVFQVLGVLMIVSAVLTGSQAKGIGSVSRRNLVLGIVIGVAGLAIMVVGLVIVKPLLERSPLLWATEIRLFGGCIVLAVILIVYPKRREVIRSLITSGRWGYTVSGSFLGAYLSMITWLAGMKFTTVSVASALNQTSNIFVFIFAAVFLREAVNLRRIIGICLAIAGSLIVMFG